MVPGKPPVEGDERLKRSVIVCPVRESRRLPDETGCERGGEFCSAIEFVLWCGFSVYSEESVLNEYVRVCELI